MKRQTLLILAALVAGMALGIAVAGDATVAARVRAILEPVGTLWINAIRMTVIPLVTATVLAALLTPGSEGAVKELGVRAIGWMYACVLAATAISLAVTLAVLSRVPVGGSTVTGADLPSGAETGAGAIVRWIVELVPANPVKAAADGAMLSLLIFVAVFAIAAIRIGAQHRERIRAAAEAVSETMFVVVRWVLVVAPVGVFALAAVLGIRMGAAAAGAVLLYVVLVAMICALVAVGLYVLAMSVGRTPLSRFAPAAAPGQAVALSARASMPALPAMLEGGLRLGVHENIRSVFLPVAAAIFRTGTAVWMPVAVLFLARLYGVDVGWPALLTMLAFAPLLTFSVPSVPAGSLLISAPLLAATGIPAEGLGILLAADTIPDMVRTGLNVTGHMSVATVLHRGASRRDPGPEL